MYIYNTTTNAVTIKLLTGLNLIVEDCNESRNEDD